MNTPEHLKPFEAAARSYCAKVGVDPDATVKMPHPLARNAVIDGGQHKALRSAARGAGDCDPLGIDIG